MMETNQPEKTNEFPAINKPVRFLTGVLLNEPPSFSVELNFTAHEQEPQLQAASSSPNFILHDDPLALNERSVEEFFGEWRKFVGLDQPVGRNFPSVDQRDPRAMYDDRGEIIGVNGNFTQEEVNFIFDALDARTKALRQEREGSSEYQAQNNIIKAFGYKGE